MRKGRTNKHAFETGLRNYEELKIIAKMPKLKRRKFTEEQVKMIRKSTLSDTELAKIYGVARGVIYSIRKKKSYKEIV